MPHLALEYSANLEGKADIAALCRELHAAVMASGLFELGAVRVRAFAAPHYAVADLDPRNAFIDMSFRVGQGRTAVDLRSAGELIFAAATKHCAKLLAEPHFALSLEVREINSELSWKKNAIHPRLRGQ
ncbi:MAG: 5-carboxymethyl-2-hydroxymuconate Delta-isomerase [Proteobacteria bacterium]|nr:5-carboxymethyl-2-hydroxymuconate Delta-isomerase [Pseudomonadota bacterium]